MDLTQLEYFRVVARYENITRAAKDLYVSQPTLSQSIARLESSLGIELFDRVNGKLHLNDAGRMFLERVNNAFFELNLGFNELDRYKADHQDWIYVASSVIDIFKVIMLEYYKVNPNVHIDHSLTSDRNIMEMLLNSKVEFAITPTPINDPSIKTVPLYKEEIFAVVGRDHPLASHREVSLEELREYPLICNSCDSDIQFMERLFQTDYRNLNIIGSSNESHIPAHFTTRNYSVGFIPGRIAVRHLKEANEQIILRLIGVARQTTCISTKYSHQLSPSAQDLYRFILDFCAKESVEVQRFINSYYSVSAR